MAGDLGGDPDRAISLAREVQRLADRLRTMSDVRLGQPFPPALSRAAAVLALAQHLAEAAQGIEERGAPLEPRWRTVPDDGVFALGDQVFVTGTDVVGAAGGLATGEPVWTRSGRRPVGDVLAALVVDVQALRQAF